MCLSKTYIIYNILYINIIKIVYLIMYLIMSDYSMGETPDNAFEYLRPLLTFASDNIPKEKHKVTPV